MTRNNPRAKTGNAPMNTASQTSKTETTRVPREKWPAGLLDVAAAACLFSALAVFFITWQPERDGWAFLVHLLVNAAFALSLLSTQLQERRLEAPFTAPEMALGLLLVYGVVNAWSARILYPAMEILPFFLDGILLFYLGKTLLRRRYEVSFPLFFILIAGILLAGVQTGQSDLWRVEGNPSSFYRGDKMMDAALSERPLLGSGSGGFKLLTGFYLPLPYRHPPSFSSGFWIFLAEQGLFGLFAWMLFLFVLSLSLAKPRKERLKRSERTVFFLTLAGLLALLGSGLFSSITFFPKLALLILPLAGLALGLGRGNPSPPANVPPSFTGSLFTAAVLIPILILTLFEAAPPLALSLSRLRNPEELGTGGFGRKTRLACFLIPWHPEVHLSRAKHLRLLQAREKTSPFLTEASYLRAIQKNPHLDRYYLEYGHYLDMRGEHIRLASLLERGTGNCPGSMELRLFLFRTYMKIEKRREALDALDSLRAFFPIDFPTHHRMGSFYLEAGAKSAGIEALTLAAQLNPLFIGETKEDTGTSGEGRKEDYP